MASLTELPPEMLNQVASQLSTVDLGNLAMTFSQMRHLFEPLLSNMLKRLVFANPNSVRLVKPEHPEAYGINEVDFQDLNNDKADPAAVSESLKLLVEDLYTCPMLAKYVKHVFIDYIKLSSWNPT